MKIHPPFVLPLGSGDLKSLGNTWIALSGAWAMRVEAAKKPENALNWKVFLVTFGVLAAFLVARTLYTTSTTPLFGDTDDAMRMVVVRDFLHGQNWFDHTQYRLDTPFGAQIHWSRLVDLPIAALILAIGPFAGPMTETIVAFVWPMILLFCLLYLSAKLVLRLVGSEGLLPALVLPAFSPAIMTEFSPGRLDHHSVKIILTLLIIFCSIEALTRPRFAIGAGVAAATAIAIGTECLPIIAAVVMVFGFIYVFCPERSATVRAFGLSFGLAALLHLTIALPPQSWLTPTCDAISIVYMLAALGVGLVFTILAALPLRQHPSPVRLIAGAALGGALLAGLLFAFPQCLKGPYAAVDPWLIEHWLGRITEAEPLWTSVASMPAFAISVTLPSFLALAIIAYNGFAAKQPDRSNWLILGLFLAFAVAVMLAQVRGARIAGIIAIPAGAWLIAAARARYIARGGVGNGLRLLRSWIAFAGIALILGINAVIGLVPGNTPASTEIASGSRAPCLIPEAFADLAALPPERIMTPIDLGSHMLLNTGHAVVSAPYHRAQKGVRDTFDFFNLPIEEVRHILDERGIGLVVTCPALPEMKGLPDAAATSFVRLAEKNQLPDWLKDVSLPGSPLKTYAVMPR
jgi:hypothetical protein